MAENLKWGHMGNPFEIDRRDTPEGVGRKREIAAVQGIPVDHYITSKVIVEKRTLGDDTCGLFKAEFIMRNLFLALAIIGAVVPYAFFVAFFAEHGIDLMTFIPALFVNGAASGFTVDLLITSLVFWIYLLVEKAEKPWIYILVNLTIGLSCALPLYLYVKLGKDA